MNTDAKLRVRDSHANPSPPPAHSGPKTPPTADQRPLAISSEQVSINKDVYEAHVRVISTVFDFLAVEQSPVDAVNELLYAWITTSANLKPGYYDSRHLKRALELTGFLYDLQGDLKNLDYLEQEADKLSSQPQEGQTHD